MTTRLEALAEIRGKYPNYFCIFSNGLTSRDAVSLFGLDGSFYMLHAMGEALPVGIGLARELPNVSVLVVEGDGSAMMGAANWSCEVPTNLTYVVLANGSYETTGDQALPEDVTWPAYSEIYVIDEPSPSAPNPPLPANICAQSLRRLEELVG